MEVKGRDLLDGFPKTFVLTESEIREALRDAVMTIAETVRTCLEQTPPELAADIVDTGIVLAGGGGLLRGLDRLLERETQLPVTIAQHPMSRQSEGCTSGQGFAHPHRPSGPPRPAPPCRGSPR